MTDSMDECRGHLAEMRAEREGDVEILRAHALVLEAEAVTTGSEDAAADFRRVAALLRALTGGDEE